MDIVLDETLLEPIRERVERGGYGDVSAYVNALIKADLLERQLLEGVRSGPPEVVDVDDDSYWEAADRDE